MKTWYQTREGSNLIHKSTTIKPNQKILLTEEQAKLHAGDKEWVVPSEPPKKVDECAIGSEFNEWQLNKPEEKAKKLPG